MAAFQSSIGGRQFAFVNGVVWVVDAMVYACAAFVGAVGLLGLARRKVAGTTLAAVWAWAAAAVIAVGGVESGVWLSAGGNGMISGLPRWADAARYAAAVLALCPTIALLGAKRPQDRAWQWVVAAFWTAMMVPAARACLLQGGVVVALHAAQGAFLLVIVAMGVANWIATRFAVAAIVGGGAQALLVAPYTPLAVWLPETPIATQAAALVGIALAIAICFCRRRTAHAGDPIERQWLDFRDQFGLFWSARVMARLNVAARAHGWPMTIQWGRIAFDAQADEQARAAVGRCLRMLLRRFVSAEWLSAKDRAA